MWILHGYQRITLNPKRPAFRLKMNDPIVEKTTLVKSAEPLKLKSSVFAKGFKVEVSWNLDPANPIHLDQIMLKTEDSSLKQAVEAFIKYNESLGYKHLTDGE